ncbi:MAG: hypothetical protein AAF415_01910 [Pseudomonadota bacterium]
MYPDVYLPLDLDLHLAFGVVAVFVFLVLAVIELGVQMRRLFGRLAMEMERHDPALLAHWDWPLVGARTGWGDRRQVLRRELIEARVFLYGLPIENVSKEARRLARKYRTLSGLCLLLSLLFWYGIFAYEVGRYGWDIFNLLGILAPALGMAALWLLVPRWPRDVNSGREEK